MVVPKDDQRHAAGEGREVWSLGLSGSVRAGASRTHPYPGPLGWGAPWKAAATGLRHTAPQPPCLRLKGPIQENIQSTCLQLMGHCKVRRHAPLPPCLRLRSLVLTIVVIFLEHTRCTDVRRAAPQPPCLRLKGPVLYTVS